MSMVSFTETPLGISSTNTYRGNVARVALLCGFVGGLCLGVVVLVVAVASQQGGETGEHDQSADGRRNRRGFDHTGATKSTGFNTRDDT